MNRPGQLGISVENIDPSASRVSSHQTPQFKNKSLKLNSILAQELESSGRDHKDGKQNHAAASRQSDHQHSNPFRSAEDLASRKQVYGIQSQMFAATPNSDVEHHNGRVDSANTGLNKERTKVFPLIKKTGNILIAHGKSGIPLANKGRLTKTKNRPVIPRGPTED